jgi:hypothetical protein
MRPSQSRKLSPEERRRLRERYERFKKLPPEEKERLRKRLEEFEKLPEAERNRLKRRYDYFQRFSPEQRERLRQFERALAELAARSSSDADGARQAVTKASTGTKGEGPGPNALLAEA